MLSRLLSDRESLISIIAQALNLILPMIVMFMIYEKEGAQSVVDFEIVLSLVAFFSILQDYSTSYLLSGYRFHKNVLFKYFLTLLVFKQLNALFCLIILVLFYFSFGNSFELYFTAGIIIFLASFDIPLGFFSRGLSFIHAFLYALRTLVCVSLICFGISALDALVVSYIFLAFSIVLFYIKVSKVFFSISTRSIRLFYRKLKLPTLTEGITALFSQLDAYLVSLVASEKTILLYVTVRKFVRAVNVFTNYLLRIGYTRFIRNEESWIIPTCLVMVISVIALIFLVFWGPTAFAYLFPNGEVFQGLTILFVVQSSILVVGAFKGFVRNFDLLANQKYTQHLVYTCMSGLIFLLPLILAYILKTEYSAVELSVIRVIADITYIFFWALVLFFIKRVSK